MCNEKNGCRRADDESVRRRGRATYPAASPCGQCAHLPASKHRPVFGHTFAQVCPAIADEEAACFAAGRLVESAKASKAATVSKLTASSIASLRILRILKYPCMR